MTASRKPQVRWKMADISRGLRLRELGLTYDAITIVFREYHGIDTTSRAVHHQLRRFGAEPRPRGAGSANLRRGHVT